MTKDKPPLEEMTLRQLRRVASAFNVSRYSRMRKDQLLAAILDAQQQAGTLSNSDLNHKVEAQEDVEATKFDLGQDVFMNFSLSAIDAELPELPAGYGESCIVLMPRDPQWAYAYWDISNEAKSELRMQGGQQLALRLYDVTNQQMGLLASPSIQEYPCDEMARNWYLPIPVSDRDYFVEIGYRCADGRWLVLARSQSVRVPPVYPSEWVEDRYVTIGWDEDLTEKTFLNLVPGLSSMMSPIYDEIAAIAARDHVAGSITGSGQMVIGSGQMVTGSGQMVTGSGQMVTGSGQMVTGSGQMVTGSGQMITGSGQMVTGSGQMVPGSGQMTTGSGQMVTGSGQMIPGSGQMTTGSGQMVTGSGQMIPGSGQMTTGSGQMVTGSGQMIPGSGQMTTGSGQMVTGSGQMIPGSAQMVTGSGQMVTGSGQMIPGSGQMVTGSGQMVTGSGQMIPGSAQMVTGSGQMIPGSGQMVTGSGQMITGSGQMIPGSAQMVTGSGQMIPGSAQMVTGSGQMIPGSGQMVTGSGQMIPGSAQMVTGSGQMIPGSAQMVTGSGQMIPGSAQMVTGSGQMIPGSGQMIMGSGQMIPGSVHMVTGSGQMVAGSAQMGLSSYVFPSGMGMWASGLTMSGAGFSASAPPIRPRSFWLVADAELIVYGATEPDANVTIGGKPITLNPDGTFRIQLSFQDGQLDFPIMAVAADGEQTRSVHMNFNRVTPSRHTNTKEEAVTEWLS